MCFGAIDKKCRNKSYYQMQLKKGWECWEKNAYLFPHSQFLFIEEEVAFGSDIVLHIFVINKESFLATLHQNKNLFKDVLGEDFSPESLLNTIEKKKQVRPLLNYDEALFGILLGYGVESPVAYKMHHQKITIERGDWNRPDWTANYQGIEAKTPKRCHLDPVAFVGDPQSEEVQTLLNHYSQELEEIWITYKKTRDPLKLALDKLLEDSERSSRIEQNDPHGQMIGKGCNPNRLKTQVPILRHKVDGVLTHPSENNEYANFSEARHRDTKDFLNPASSS